MVSRVPLNQVNNNFQATMELDNKPLLCYHFYTITSTIHGRFNTQNEMFVSLYDQDALRVTPAGGLFILQFLLFSSVCVLFRSLHHPAKSHTAWQSRPNYSTKRVHLLLLLHAVEEGFQFLPMIT